LFERKELIAIFAATRLNHLPNAIYQSPNDLPYD